MNRDKLYDRINRRVDIMTDAGLIEEVSKLRNMGYDLSLTSMQAIGYKEIYSALDVIENEKYSPGSSEYEEVIHHALEQIKLNTRHFAKRQLTWFRREKDVIWLDKDEFSKNYSLDSNETDDEILNFILNKCRYILTKE